jgi:hypothetical protein
MNPFHAFGWALSRVILSKHQTPGSLTIIPYLF